jgi:ABC-type glutathione transport system ATPase component
MLNVSDLTVQYGQRNIVNKVSFSIEKGKILGIAGASGSGKTTLALAIPGLLSDRATVGGTLTLGTDSFNLAHADTIANLRGKKIGFVFQEPLSSLNPVLTCGQQIAETVALHLGTNPSETGTKVREWLQKVQIQDIERTMNAFPHELSGGQLQRVMIAIALCGQPDLLIADEPTTALDVTVQKSVLDLLKDLQQALQLTTLLVSHDTKVLRYMCDHIGTMKDGDMIEIAPVLPAVHSDGIPTTGPQQPGTPLVFEHPGITVSYPAKRSFWGKPKHWFNAVDAVPVRVYAGECLGIVGESGSGKTSLGQAIAQHCGYAKGGAVIIDQHPASALNPSLTVGEALLETVRHFSPQLRHQDARQRVAQLLEWVELPQDTISRYPHEISGGQKQRVCIARGLSAAPTLLICDEIVSGLDPINQKAVLQLLKNLQRQRQCAIVFITHDLDVVREISDRIMVMHQGKLQEEQPTELLFRQPQQPYTHQLLAARL